MVEEFVRKEHFDEYALCMDERFLSVEKRMEQGFSHAEKAREQNLFHINQRFDGLRGEIRSLRTLVLGLHTLPSLRIGGHVVFRYH